MQVEQALQHAAHKLQEITHIPFLEAEVILAHVLETNRASLIAHDDRVLTLLEEQHFNNMVGRRLAGTPIPYITNQKDFYGRTFMVDEHVLVPRSETEMIIDIVKELATPTDSILDIGTGSGCIAITLKKELPESTVTAIDIDEEALQIAFDNAEMHQAEINFAAGDLFLPVKEKRFDIIVTNPPYVDPETVDLESPESIGLTFEPQHALFSKGTPLGTVKAIIKDTPQHLTEFGALIIEIGHNQGKETKAFAQEIFPEHSIEIRKDLHGHDRFAIITATSS